MNTVNNLYGMQDCDTLNEMRIVMSSVP